MSLFYILVEYLNMFDHVLDGREGAVEYLPRDLELAEKPVNRRLQATETGPDADDVRRELSGASKDVVAPPDLQVARQRPHRVEGLAVVDIGRQAQEPAATNVVVVATTATAFPGKGEGTAATRAVHFSSVVSTIGCSNLRKNIESTDLAVKSINRNEQGSAVAAS